MHALENVKISPSLAKVVETGAGGQSYFIKI